MTKQKDGETSRRAFLKLATTTVPAAAASVALSADDADALEQDNASEGLRETAHTRTYYELARF